MTSLTEIAILSFALGFDAFAVAAAIGISFAPGDRWSIFRLSFHFGFAQFGMPLVGWRIGEIASAYVGSLGDWVAAVILFILGARLIWEQANPDQRHWKGDPTRGVSLLVLMFATSVDALAAGLSLGLIGTDILYPALVIGVVAAAMTITGLVFGRKLGTVAGRAAGVAGGVVLIALAIRTAFF